VSENIADLAGLLAAHDAYLLSRKGKADVVIGGLSGEQRFFLAFSKDGGSSRAKPRYVGRSQPTHIRRGNTEAIRSATSTLGTKPTRSRSAASYILKPEDRARNMVIYAFCYSTNLA